MRPSTEVGVGMGVDVGVGSGVGIGVGVGVGAGVGMGVDCGVEVGVGVGVGASVGAEVGAGIGVMEVGVVEVGVGVGVGASVGAEVGAGIGVSVEVGVGVGVGASVGAEVGAGIGVIVEVGVGVRVGAGVDVCAVASEVSMPCAASSPSSLVQATRTRQPTRLANSSAATVLDKMLIPFSCLPQRCHIFSSFGVPLGILSANAQIPKPLTPPIPIIIRVRIRRPVHVRIPTTQVPASRTLHLSHFWMPKELVPQPLE